MAVGHGVQAAAQLVTGVFVVNLFVFVRVRSSSSAHPLSAFRILLSNLSGVRARSALLALLGRRAPLQSEPHVPLHITPTVFARPILSSTMQPTDHQERNAFSVSEHSQSADGLPQFEHCRLQALRYGQSCLLSLFYVAISVVLSQDVHVGARIMGCAGLLGPAWIGLIMTGSLVSTQPVADLSRSRRAVTACDQHLSCRARPMASGLGCVMGLTPRRSKSACRCCYAALHQPDAVVRSGGKPRHGNGQTACLGPSCQGPSHHPLRPISTAVATRHREPDHRVMPSLDAARSLAPPQLSLAHAPGVAYTTFLCIFVSLGILLAVFLRACGNPAIAGSGLALQFFYGCAAAGNPVRTPLQDAALLRSAGQAAHHVLWLECPSVLRKSAAAVATPACCPSLLLRAFDARTICMCTGSRSSRGSSCGRRSSCGATCAVHTQTLHVTRRTHLKHCSGAVSDRCCTASSERMP